MEEVHLALAAENSSPVRTDREVGRLWAQLFTAQSSLTAEQDSARRSEESKHLLRWELPSNSVGEAEGEKWVKRSLAEIEPALAWEQDQAKFIGARQLHWEDDRRTEQYEKASASYAFLVEEARVREEQFSRTYPGKSHPEPRFTYWEISKLELHAAKETDPTLKAKYETLYRQALENPYEDRSRTILIEKDADELLDPVSTNDHPRRNSDISGRAHVPEYTHEMSFER